MGRLVLVYLFTLSTIHAIHDLIQVNLKFQSFLRNGIKKMCLFFHTVNSDRTSRSLVVLFEIIKLFGWIPYEFRPTSDLSYSCNKNLL